ncbi:MAG: phosphotransferase [Lachnospirales bacterium]
MSFDEIKVEVMSGGVTNKNYKLILNNKKYAVRIAGIGTENYIDRKKEFSNVSQMAEIGIAPKIYFSDMDTGFQISEFIEGSTLTAEDILNSSSLLKAAANIMRRCHNSGAVFESVFNPVDKININLAILKEKKYSDFFPNWENMIMYFNKIAEKLHSSNIKLSPCHNDTLAGNFIGDESCLKMIDWEYSGMNDPFYDLACFSMENKLDNSLENQLLNEYTNGKMTDELYLRYYENKFLTSFYWSVWSCVQIAYGKDKDFYYKYGMERYSYLSQCIYEIQRYGV